MTLELKVRMVDQELDPPRYQHAGDAGLDLCSRMDVTLQPGERVTIPTGVAVAIPSGHAGFVLPRSGLAARHGISLVNAPGLIDSGYRGEIAVLLINTDKREPFVIRRGDRIAQLVVQRVEHAVVVVVDDLDDTARGSGGFGSTGRSSSAGAVEDG